MVEVLDVVIVGSGPAGYTAAIYAGRANLSPVVIAGSVTAGGALVNTTEVDNYPGFPEGVMGPDLMDNMQQQAERFGATIVYDDVERMELLGEVKTLYTGGGEVFKAKTVILAMGAAHRSLGVPGEERLTGFGVSTCATCDGFFHKGKEVIVVGGGDTAAEEATYLSNIASKVTLVHRRDSFRASAAMVSKIYSTSNIEILWNTVVEEVRGDKTLESVVLRSGDKVFEKKVSGLFVAIGHDPRSELVRSQVQVDAEGYVETTGKTSYTNISGVFACGDLVDKSYRQAITAAGSGCAAALDAQRWLELNS